MLVGVLLALGFAGFAHIDAQGSQLRGELGFGAGEGDQGAAGGEHFDTVYRVRAMNQVELATKVSHVVGAMGGLASDPLVSEFVVLICIRRRLT